MKTDYSGIFNCFYKIFYVLKKHNEFKILLIEVFSNFEHLYFILYCLPDIQKSPFNCSKTVTEKIKKKYIYLKKQLFTKTQCLIT